MNPEEASDEELLQAIGERSIAALEELYDRHHRMAMAVAFQVLKDRHLAEDVVQEAFLAVWRRPESYNPDRGRGRPWLLSVVRHRAIDVTRGRSFGRERLSLEEMELEPRYPDPWHEVSRNLERDRIKSAVESLTPEQKEAIDLAYFGGYTQRMLCQCCWCCCCCCCCC